MPIITTCPPCTPDDCRVKLDEILRMLRGDDDPEPPMRCMVEIPEDDIDDLVQVLDDNGWKLIEADAP